MNPFALTAEERAGAIMAPARTPDVGSFMDNLGALRAMLGPSVASRMQAHGEDQEARWAAGERGPTPLTEDRVWLADDVAGALLGPMGMAGVIKAYHGSPHRFDRFDMSKIGTGEGAQAYGHGLYFAEKEGTAKAYRQQLSGDNIEARNFFKDGSIVDGIGNIIVGSKEAARQAVPMPSDHANQIAQDIEDWVKKGRKAGTFLKSHEVHEPYRAAYEAAAKAWEGVTYKKNKGALYTTRLDVDPEDLLDWDAPLSQQSEKVRAALESSDYGRMAVSTARTSGFGTADPTGEQIYQALQPYGEKGASTQRLREAGIPGIRYLDQGSRASGEGTRNFVIFDDKLISIESVE